MLLNFRIDLFGYMVFFLVKPTKEENDFIKSELDNCFYIDGEIEGAAICQQHDVYNIILISTPYGKTSAGFRGLMAHEISHAASFIMERYNIQDDEVRSILCEYMTNELYNKQNIKRVGKRISEE